ncbi:MAG: family 16 glycoside hydrolase, partial [Bacteroidota bacterium]
PGLWQHYKIIFHAPQFDAAGNKIKNASFGEVWLNGIKLHENVSLNGPTRAAAFEDEVAMGPLMLQGDHGPVAYRNIQYKKYDGVKLEPKNLVLAEYGHDSEQFPSLDTLTAKSSGPTDSISYQAGSIRQKFLLAYQGELEIPKAGDYIFHLNTARAGVALIINQDTLFSIEKRVEFDQDFRAMTQLEAGSVPFQILYNKFCCPWARGFVVEVEGPGVQRHALTSEGSAYTGDQPEPILVETAEEPVLQRGFLMHNGTKLTHVISVSTPADLHYAYDLAMGSLLQVWSGAFLDVTDMWHARGQKQLSKPRGPIIDFHGQPNVFALSNASSAWPDSLAMDQNFKPIGYEIDDTGYPIFIYETNGVEVRNELLPSDTERRMTRKVSLSDGNGLWLKIDEGDSIKALADGSYTVNDYEYFVEIADELKSTAKIRDVAGKQELLIELQSGATTVQYDIIW